MRLPPAPDPEIRCRQMPSAVAGVGRLDQPLQHVERRRLQPITSAEHGDEQLDGAQLTRAPVDQARPLAGKPLHVAAYIRTHPGSAPTVKQHLAAIRVLCDWLVVHQVLPVNPAAAVRGPKLANGTSVWVTPATGDGVVEQQYDAR